MEVGATSDSEQARVGCRRVLAICVLRRVEEALSRRWNSCGSYLAVLVKEVIFDLFGCKASLKRHDVVGLIRDGERVLSGLADSLVRCDLPR